MSSVWGNHLKLSIFGESHGPAIGVVIDSLPAGVTLDWEEILIQMARRAPGKDKSATPRAEKDEPEVQSGLLCGTTTGAPLCAVIKNTNTRSGDYANVMEVPRPSHADYPAYVRYHGKNDVRGGGHFSGRLTAPLVFAGAVCRQALKKKGVFIGGHVASIGALQDEMLDKNKVDAAQLEELSHRAFATLNPEAEKRMREEIEKARMQCDSVGGTVECAVIGLPTGLGSNIFSTVESKLSSILFAIPAAKAVSFGAGFDISTMRGSAANDPYCMDGDKVITLSNNNGGVLGGMTTGAPLIVRVAFKPTASIAQEQRSVNLVTGRDASLTVHGRHDPCIVPRALPVVEAAVAVALLDLFLEDGLWA